MVGLNLREHDDFTGLNRDVDSVRAEDVPVQSGAGINADTGLPTTPYNTNRGAAGTTDVEAPQITPERTPASMLESFSAGVGEQAQDFYKAIRENMVYEPDPSYNSKQDLERATKLNMVRSEEDMQWLGKANSAAAFEDRLERLQEKYESNEVRSDNFWSGIAGSLLDIDTAIGVVSGGVGTIAKVGKVGKAAIAGSTALGASTAVVASAGDSTQLDSVDKGLMIASSVLGGAFAVTQSKRGIKATTSSDVGSTATKPLGDIVEDELETLMKQSVPEEQVYAKVNAGSVDIPISRPQYDADGNMLLPKGSLERQWQAQGQSVADQNMYYLKGDTENPLFRIVSSPAYTQGDDVPSLARTLEAKGDVALAEFEEAVERAAIADYGTSKVLGRLVGKEHQQAIQNVSLDMYEGAQLIDAKVIELSQSGIKVTDETILRWVDELEYTDAVKDGIRTYIKSGYAKERFNVAKQTGLIDETADVIVERSTYMPIQHSYDRVHALLKGGDEVGKRKAIENFYGKQVAEMYPNLLTGIRKADGTMVKLTPSDLGKTFLKNMKLRASNSSTVKASGVTGDVVVDVLTDLGGIAAEEAVQLAAKIKKAGQNKQSGVKNFRRRISWDFSLKGELPDGSLFSMKDLIEAQPMMTLNEYNRRISGRSALAKYGLTDEVIEANKLKVLDDLPEGVSRAKASKFYDNMISVAKGEPVGERLPDVVQNSMIAARSIVLAGSGMYQAVELATQIQKMGVLRSVPHLISGMRPMFHGMKSYTKQEAKELNEMLIGYGMSPDRWKRIYTQHGDDFNVTSSFSETMGYLGQSTNFLNGSEFIKRYQIGLFADITVDAFKGAANGSESSIKYLKDGMKFSDELVDLVSKEYKVHGSNVNAWDADIRLAMEQKVLHEMDNVALKMNHGEIPDFMQYSTFGKVIFPFMSFVWGAHNKILRRTYVRDGVAGVAMVMAVQFPLAMMVAQLRQLMNTGDVYDLDNEQDTKDFLGKTITAMSSLGLFGIPYDVIMNEGKNLGSSTVFTPLQKAFGLSSAITSEDGASFRDFKEATPLNPILPLNLFMTAIEEED
jgi:hypothetical protein